MTESSQKCPPADKPMTDRPTVSELRKAAHEAVDRIEAIYRKGWTTVGKRDAHAAIDALAPTSERNIREEMRGGSIGALIERAEKAEREIERLTAACRFALDEWFEPHYGTNDVGMAALVRDRLRAALRGDKP